MLGDGRTQQLDKIVQVFRRKDIDIDTNSILIRLLDMMKGIPNEARFANSTRRNKRSITTILKI